MSKQERAAAGQRVGDPRYGRSETRATVRGAIAVVLVISAAVVCPPDLGAQFSGSGIKYPVYYAREELAKGQTNFLKMLLIGKSVDLRADSTFFIQQMRIEHYGPDGRTNLVAHAPDCVLDRVRNTASSASRLEVQAETGSLFLEGQGFFCNLTNLNLLLSNRVETRLREDLAKSARARRPGQSRAVTNLFALTNSLAVTNAGTNYITIFADRLLYAYASNTVTYLDNVRVDTSEFAMTCNHLDGHRATNGTLERIIAQQDVVFFNKLDRSSGFGDRVVYEARDGGESILLTGSDARWQDALRAARAKSFFFDIKEQRLVAEREAYIRLPRSAIGPQTLLPGRAPASTNVNTTATTNAPVGDLEVWAELLTMQLPTTNQPARTVTASTNVVVTSSADNSRATGDHAKYSEATGILEVNGQAYWQSGQRIMACDDLFLDRTNRVFTGTGNAYIKLPLADLGPHGVLAPFASTRTNAAGTNLAQFVELWCDQFDYRSSLLTFRDRVRSRFLEETNPVGALNCGVLQARFYSNEVESVTAKTAVHLEQFPYTSTNGTTVRKSLNCETLTALLDTNGFIRRVIAETNVHAVQIEESRTNPAPTTSSLDAQLVVGEFFAHTNRLRELVAMKKVRLTHDKNRASGERAVYYVTNQIVELTGQPSADLPELQGGITEAEMLTYDLARKQFYIQKGRGTGVANRGSSDRTNRSNLRLPQ
ncbi:MAG: hypothetical protein L0Y58_23925 [Verrucomicrobia subdivision 3 bacterium]|nr:hypothetical protein [Limisphaerales bacterium]